MADLDATDPASHELEEGVRLASGDRLEQFARAGTGDAFCFVGEGADERPVVYVSIDGEAGQLEAIENEYRSDLPDLGQRRDRAARALGITPTELPSQATALARFKALSQGPVAKTCRVVGYEGEPFAPLYDTTQAWQ
ncbi:hypothetical protein ACFU3O_34765 [Streptomyces antibioticus]|uniref:hypothetical protein n=1 Tax=Streptomyces antibioticus TaxID=1890 RepID=UPI0036AB275E